MLAYHAHFFKTDQGWYVVEVPDFPGVSSQGKTLRSARVMIRDALKVMAECLVDEGKPLPGPNAKAKPSMGLKADYREVIALKTRFLTPAVK
jgi:predicted RNase H-like HicB family nuclease